METNPSLWFYFMQAGLVVKMVMLLLVAASIFSWTVIIQRSRALKQAQKRLKAFETRFWDDSDLASLYKDIAADDEKNKGLASLFHAGFREFSQWRKNQSGSLDKLLDNARRAMRVAQARELDKLEQHLPFLASVGSVSPYVGLFGTVWGIMTAFHALGGVQQATIAMVAPGISEALIATAMGLFAAIPAVLAYNRFNDQVQRTESQFSNFQEEFCHILQHQAEDANAS